MFWLYVPPIIFIAALVVLVIILGKKTAALKKDGSLAEREQHFQNPGRNSGKRFKNIGNQLLNILELLVGAVKGLMKSAETGLAGTLGKIKEKRLRKSNESKSAHDLDHQDDIVRLIQDKEIDNLNMEPERKETPETKTVDLRRIAESPLEITVKKKPEVIPQRIVPERAEENKVREDALIHRIAENPKDIEAYRELGDYYLSVGNLKDAKDSFKMVLKLRPRDLKAKSSLREMEMRIRLGEKI